MKENRLVNRNLKRSKTIANNQKKKKKQKTKKKTKTKIIITILLTTF